MDDGWGQHLQGTLLAPPGALIPSRDPPPGTDVDVLILGLSDGPVANAALVSGGQLRAAVHGSVAPRGGDPFACADEVLASAGFRKEDVALVAVAGRYTPPFWARRRGVSAEAPHDPFRPGLLFAGTAVQVGLRRTGLGAWDADRATEWFEARVRERGYAPRRVVLVDIHNCLAECAYRCQPEDDVLVVVVHPRGDGVLVSAHRGRAGQLDRLTADKSSTSAHLWFDRCVSAAGLSETEEAVLPAGGAVDHAALELLRETLWINSAGRLRGVRLAHRRGRPWQALADLGADAPATIAAHLRQVLAELVAQLHGKYGGANLAVAGAWMRDPRLVAALADLPGVRNVWAGPFLGRQALAPGAALSMAGTAPRLPAVGLATALPSALAVAEALARGEGVAVPGPFHFGAWVRADDAAALRRVRQALRRPAFEQPEFVALSGVVRGEGLAGPLRFGAAAAGLASEEVTAGVPVRVVGDDAFGAQVLRTLQERSGCSAVLSVPLALDGDGHGHLNGQAARTAEAAAAICAATGITWERPS